ncbi:TonB-dependent receptor [Ramlibacter sp. MAHUQ-53]|uniref:TonB-dependent receptor n=1 Tax=unclassified Ramlibacter TaxID=2617605 RepID=UPI00363D4277
MQKFSLAAALAAAGCLAPHARAQANDEPARSLGVVTITSGAPTSLPTQIPATVEGITRAQIERDINATDSGDALKYLPSLLVRKRYVGDYNHAILSSRASGTGNSARSAVYADGILLSNFLGNGVGGLSFPPRWGLVTPEEIERVDVMYGPFSAAYPGNSVGAVVEYTTRMPTRFEAHGKAGLSRQPFEYGGTQAAYRSWQASASAGSRAGDWAWWFNLHRTEAEGQPLTFATRLLASGTPGGTGTPVTGAVLGRNGANAPWYLLGAATQYTSRQDHAKARLAYDFSPTLRATYTVGAWQNDAEGRPASWLRDAAGRPVTSGPIHIDGRSFAPLSGADFPLTRESLTHVSQGLALKRHTQGEFDWEMAASRYRYARDLKRQNAANNPLPAAEAGGAGTVADGSGTGWTTLAVKGTWRPVGAQGRHVVDAGLQQDSFALDYRTRGTAGSWIDGEPGPLVSDTGGRTRLRSAWAQDTWAFAPRWKAVLGGRLEQWSAEAGRTRIPGAVPAVDAAWPSREATFFSPKAAVSWQWQPGTVLKAALGRAVRMPTVAELYGATSTANARYINDPALRPERSWTGELSAEKDLGQGLLRVTGFAEDTRDALYSQALFDPAANLNVTRVQNVGRIATRGVEAAATAWDALARGLDLTASLTWADSRIRENAGFVAVPGDTLGKRQPNIPRWRAAATASYRWTPEWTTTLAARYSGTQYRTLNNSDVNGFTYMGVSRFLVLDLRVRHQLTKTTALAFGIDNLTGERYWNFHPYPQRSLFAEMKVDL